MNAGTQRHLEGEALRMPIEGRSDWLTEVKSHERRSEANKGGEPPAKRDRPIQEN
jgi:hypothetical protein